MTVSLLVCHLPIVSKCHSRGGPAGVFLKCTLEESLAQRASKKPCQRHALDRLFAMSELSADLLLDQALRAVARRYRLPPLAASSRGPLDGCPATTLAITIEEAREARVRGDVPAAASKCVFVEALARMIREAMRTETGDSVFQAMVLRHKTAQVREYASLSAHAEQDRRRVRATTNAIAHPAKQQRTPSAALREALGQLHASALSASWVEFHHHVERLLAMPEAANEPPIQHGLMQLLDSPASGRLRRGECLASDESVRQYRSLRERNGPRPGSPDAVAQGLASRERGAAVEALTTQALDALATRLNATQGSATSYRVVTSMRVPPSLPASPERAKSEWDAVLLRRANRVDEMEAWDVCLLVEAKSSVDAATTDLQRLLRGIRLLSHADEYVAYAFATQQGTVRLRGASLHALATDEASLARSVLYCCDAPAEMKPRLLGAASRMQLLSAPASLEFANLLAEQPDADVRALEPVWLLLLASPRWSVVRNQYQTLRLTRELMAHPEDMLAVADDMADNH
jgi:hypothetical protein